MWKYKNTSNLKINNFLMIKYSLDWSGEYKKVLLRFFLPF
jgi:hypothetical protein